MTQPGVSKKRDLICSKCGAKGVHSIKQMLCSPCYSHWMYMRRRESYLAGGKNYIPGPEKRRRAAEKRAREQAEQQDA